jgi:hypothetical protein
MTRKHFVALALALRGAYPYGRDRDGIAVLTWERTARAVADVCYASNPLFDRERFMRAATPAREE